MGEELDGGIAWWWRWCQGCSDEMRRGRDICIPDDRPDLGCARAKDKHGSQNKTKETRCAMRPSRAGSMDGTGRLLPVAKRGCGGGRAVAVRGIGEEGLVP